MELNEILMKLENRFGTVADIIKKQQNDSENGSCPTCTGAMFGTDYCSDCSGHCQGGGLCD